MDGTKQLIEKKLNSRDVFKGHLLDVYKDSVSLPNGKTSSREYICHPGATAVLPVFENGDIILLRQFRYPVGQIFYEVPAGKIDQGEDPETTGWRELEEETGFKCRNLAYIGHFYPTVGYSDEVIHLYNAWDLFETQTQTDDDEFLISERMPFAEALEMVKNGTITDGKTIIILLQSWNWWQNHGPFSINQK